MDSVADRNENGSASEVHGRGCRQKGGCGLDATRRGPQRVQLFEPQPSAFSGQDHAGLAQSGKVLSLPLSVPEFLVVLADAIMLVFGSDKGVGRHQHHALQLPAKFGP